MSGWNVVSEKNEKVMDTNPQVWLEAAKTSLRRAQYEETLGNTQQARQLTDSYDIKMELAAIDIAAYYGQGNIAAVTNIKINHHHNEWVDFFAKKPQYVIMYMENYRKEWEAIWRDTISKWMANHDYIQIETNLTAIGVKMLAELADNDFVFYAAEKNHVTLLDVLCHGGYDLAGCIDANKNNLTIIAVINNAEQTLDFLLQHGINNLDYQGRDGVTALMHAANKTTSGMAEKIISAGANVNIKDNLGMTALMYGAQVGNDATVQNLINAQADVNAEDNSGNTALIYAADKESSSSSMPKLLSAGANINKRNKNGFDALYKAIYRNQEWATLFLLQNGANVHIRYSNHENKTPLILAIAKGMDFIVIHDLIEAGSDIRAVDDKGRDALYYAVKKQKSSIVDFLLQKGVNPNKVYKGLAHNKGSVDNTLLLDIASGEHWKSCGYNIAELLIKYGADVNAQDSAGNTSLMLSVDNNWTLTNELKLPRLLIHKGARTDIKNNSGDTVHDIMRRRNIPFQDLHTNKTSYTSNVGFMRLFQ